MKTDSTDPADDLFIKALEINDLVAREAFLNEKCAHDATLLQRVRALLHASEVPSILDTPAVELLHTLTSNKPGDTIGRYKLLQQIDEGAFGTVFMVEQFEPVSRKVALKVIKPGMDSKQVIARFEAERQALAMMNHPNIARFLDAGITDKGLPYFVMELVRGIKITDYCDKNNLSTRERLELFILVCDAVQHAHQKGIIHRDIKPSNILVTVNDGVPVPKVIDFGIAKAIEGRLTGKSYFTAFQQFIGTPAYMSPEQAEMTSLDIDTRSDIYALGVLLYELLTGAPPFDPDELKAAGLEGMRRTIREKEPARPSTRLSTMLDADLTTIAKRRQSDAPKLVHLLRGDLDWIVMKALEKDRTRRYGTASGFAADIRHHLQNEPVVARPPSKLYRFQKSVRRNKLAVAAAAAVTAALITGLSVSTWLFFKEKSAHGRAIVAEQEQTRLRKIADENRLTEVRLRQDAEQAKADAELAKANEQKLREQADVARTTEARLRQAAETAKANEQKLRQAAEAARETEARLRQDAETARTNEQTLRAKAEAEEQKVKIQSAKFEQASKLLWLSWTGDAKYAGLNQHADLERDKTMLRDILDRNASERFGDDKPADAKAQICFNLGRFYQYLSVFDKADAKYRESLAINRKLLGNEHSTVAFLLESVASVHKQSGDWIKAEAVFREALTVKQAINLKTSGDPCNGPEDVAYSLQQLADVCEARNDLDKAETLLRESLKIRRAFAGNRSLATADSLDYVATFLQNHKHLNEAIAMFREALAMRRKLFARDTKPVAYSLYNLGAALMARGSPDANAMLSDVVTMLSEAKINVLEAEAMLREALTIQRKLLGDVHPDVVNSLEKLAFIRWMRGDLTGAEAGLRECLAIREKTMPDDQQTSYEMILLGRVLLNQKQYTVAEPFLSSGIAGVTLQKPSNILDQQWLRRRLELVVKDYEDAGQLANAAKWKQKLEEFDKATAKPK